MYDPLNLEPRSLDPVVLSWVTNVKAEANKLAATIQSYGNNREIALALTHLETAVLFAVKGIALEYGESNAE